MSAAAQPTQPTQPAQPTQPTQPAQPTGLLRTERLPRAEITGRPLGWWGVVCMVMTEAVLFGLLLFSYFYIRALSPEWPPDGIEPPHLLVVSVRSALLFASSATVSWAERGIRRGDQRRLRWGIVATLLLSAVFVAGHVEEMIRLPEEFTWRTNAYGSLFYVITNFHIAHLVIGMMILTFTLVAARRGRYTAERHLGVNVASIYWHFVDVVWLFVFPTLYLVPHLG